MTDEFYVYAQSRTKTGPGSEDFSSWENMSISPREGATYSGEIVLLCNRTSYSASTFFAQMMKAHPKAIIMGDDTGGGGGVPAYGELPNGWLYRFSSSQTINPKGEDIEGGVEVDQKVDLDPGDESNGVDTILEVALDHFN